jgi:hypothetical protein
LADRNRPAQASAQGGQLFIPHPEKPSLKIEKTFFCATLILLPDDL